MEIDEDVKEFLIEGYEYLNQIEEDLVALEKNDADREVMNRIYRGLHTIKGNSGFLGVEKQESVAHAGENLLSLLRDRTLTMTPDITSALLETIDAVRSHIEALEKTEEESPIAHTALLDRLLQLQESGGTASELSPSAIPFGIASLHAESNSVTPEVAIEEPEKSELTQEHLYADALLSIEQLLIPSATNTTSQKVNAADTEGDKFKIFYTAIRVDVGLLDKLMNLVGELVLCRNQILEFANTQTANTQNDDTLKSVSSRLNLVTS